MKILNYKIFESTRQKRAGLIPYIIKDDVVKMMFFIPSDVEYGGDKFQVAKGRVDSNEDVRMAAIREASEELGLKKENIKSVTEVGKQVLSGMNNYNYELFLYVAEILDIGDFNEFCDETGEVGWLTMEEYENKGRKSQLEIVRKCYNKIINI